MNILPLKNGRKTLITPVKETKLESRHIQVFRKFLFSPLAFLLIFGLGCTYNSFFFFPCSILLEIHFKPHKKNKTRGDTDEGSYRLGSLGSRF